MSAMTPIDRMHAVLSGQQPDRPPVSFWCHFDAQCAAGPAALDAHLEHLDRFGLDFLKVMNDNPYPTPAVIQRADDLRGLPVLSGDEEGFGLQLELIRALASELSGKVLMSTTLFNGWTVLRRIVTPRTDKTHRPPVLDGTISPVDARLGELLAEDRSAVAEALGAISKSLANFAERSIEAGADGIFLSVREDWVNTDENGMHTYSEIVARGDREILDAAGGGCMNILHVCGAPQNLAAFAEYPVHVINWADRAAGPAIRDVIGHVKPVVCGGIDNLTTLPNGSREDVRREAEDALSQAGERPMILSAGCTYDPNAVPEENLSAMVAAARSATLGE